MIDLHLHTNFSDGASTPEQLLDDAEKSGAKTISITDHINVDVYDYLKSINVKKLYSGNIIKGVEIYCGYKGKQIDILGYGINLEKIKLLLNKYFDSATQLKNLQKQFDYLYGVCKNLGVKTRKIKADKSLAFVVSFFKDNIQTFPENEKFFSNEIWQDYKKFFRLCVCNPSSPFYVDFCKNIPSLKQVVDAIHEAGGLAVLAHSWVYGFEDTFAEVKTITSLVKLDGIECYYSSFTHEQSQILLDFCEQKKLIVTGGSDYHGSFRTSKIASGDNNSISVPNVLLNQFQLKHYFVYNEIDC